MKKSVSKIISSGVIISILTAFVYIATYFNIKGFYDCYGIPSSLTVIPLSSVISISTLYVLIFSYLVLFVYVIIRYIFITFLPKLVTIPIFISVVCLCILFSFLTISSINLILIIILVNIIIISWLPLIFFQIAKRAKKRRKSEMSGKKMTFIKFLNAIGLEEVTDETESEQEPKKSNFNQIREFKSSKTFIVFKILALFLLGSFLTVFVFGNIFYGIGKSSALLREDYYYSTDFENSIIVYSDTEKFILMQYNEETNAFTSAYTIVELGNIGTMIPIELHSPTLPKVSNDKSLFDMLTRLIE